MRSEFKNRKTFEDRARDSAAIRDQHTNKVPVIVERSSSEKSLPILDKVNFWIKHRNKLNFRQNSWCLTTWLSQSWSEYCGGGSTLLLDKRSFCYQIEDFLLEHKLSPSFGKANTTKTDSSMSSTLLKSTLAKGTFKGIFVLSNLFIDDLNRWSGSPFSNQKYQKR